MCGITGFWNEGDEKSDQDNIEGMTKALIHRGPSKYKTWLSTKNNIALGHTRLSIQDLSIAGDQPMISSCERFVLIFNGEIYNHLEIRKELYQSGFSKKWNGHSDTETLLEALIYWGINKTLEKLSGMYAFALWDELKDELILARDRAGEKPLYYGVVNKILFFSSEIKSIKKHKNFKSGINTNSLYLYFKNGYIPSPYSIYEKIKKLKPASYIKITKKGLFNIEEYQYWSLNPKNYGSNRSLTSINDVNQEFEKILINSIKSQTISDIPIGALLSGGLDSSLIVSLMQNSSIKPVNTFTLGFYNEEMDESVNAKKIADYLKTNHNEIKITPYDALKSIENLSSIYDEPFADPSAVTTLAISNYVSKHLNVLLTGDAGDELLGGYARYFNTKAEKLWQLSRTFPKELIEISQKISNQLKNISTSSLLLKISQRIEEAKELSVCSDYYEYYLTMFSFNTKIPLINIEKVESYKLHSDFFKIDSNLSLMMAHDFHTYLPDNILVKVDRASMAHSVETRIPFLDHKLIEFIWSLPSELKYKTDVSKLLNRNILKKYLPSELYNKPKKGFSMPISNWLRNELKSWAEDLLSKDELKKCGYLDIPYIRECWALHKSEKYDFGRLIWSVLVWQSFIIKNNI
tara:strand:- start:394 stop:2298 length:1905 start_codon:yes stop_codon:yes gene_type:complete